MPRSRRGARDDGATQEPDEDAEAVDSAATREPPDTSWLTWEEEEEEEEE